MTHILFVPSKVLISAHGTTCYFSITVTVAFTSSRYYNLILILILIIF